MPKPIKFTTEVLARAQAQVKTATTVAEFREALAIVLPSQFGLTRKQTAEAIGLSASRVGSLRGAAQKPQKSPKNTHGGRRRQRMTLDQEKEFLLPWENEAKSAGMIIVPPLHQALEEYLGDKVHHAQVYRMLARHGWRKVAPDTTHPKTAPAAQDAWKKNSRKWWPRPS
jgi:transposase